MSESISETIKKIEVEGRVERHDLVIGVCITRPSQKAESKGKPEYLLVRKNLLDGPWYFPGGKVRDDETMEDALRREIKEELGIDYRGEFEYNSSAPYKMNDKHLMIINVMIPEEANINEPHLQEGDAIKEMAWTTDPLSYDLTEQARDTLEERLNKERIE